MYFLRSSVIRFLVSFVTGLVFFNLSLLFTEMHAANLKQSNPALYEHILSLLANSGMEEESDNSQEGASENLDDAKLIYRITFNVNTYSSLISSRLYQFISTLQLLDLTVAIVLPPPEQAHF